MIQTVAGTLYPVPDDAGNYPPAGAFPSTVDDFEGMSIAQLNALIQFYAPGVQLHQNATKKARQKVIRPFIGDYRSDV